jgi:DNA (cytosine-5)-methyltransferase 1
VREDIKAVPHPLQELSTMIGSWNVIRDLPKLRSGLSRKMDSPDLWTNAVRSIIETQWLNEIEGDERLMEEIISACNRIENSMSTGARFIPTISRPAFHASWYVDERLEGICNHSARFHMCSDLHRYMFSSCFGKVYRRSPLLKDFPPSLLPKHNNVINAIETKTRLFSDRFRVQLPDSPATTITSHLATDGHHFIHPDPPQCRSLTVREAASPQTFLMTITLRGPKRGQIRKAA